MQTEDIIKALGATLAQHVTPHLTPDPLVWKPGMTELSAEQARTKHEEALFTFQRANTEKAWEVEKCLLMLAKAKQEQEEIEKLLTAAGNDLKAAQDGSDLVKIDEATKLKAELEERSKKAEQYAGKYEAMLADEQDKFAQQDAFITLLKARLSQPGDVRSIRFKTTDDILKAAGAYTAPPTA